MAAGWAGLIAVVLLIVAAAVRYRQDIALIWPQSAGVYSSLGLHVNATGIDFRDVDYRRENEDGQVVLAVSGNIVNVGKRELPVPADGARHPQRRQQARTLSLEFQAQRHGFEAGSVGAFHHTAFQPACRRAQSGSALRQRRFDDPTPDPVFRRTDSGPGARYGAHHRGGAAAPRHRHAGRWWAVLSSPPI